MGNGHVVVDFKDYPFMRRGKDSFVVDCDKIEIIFRARISKTGRLLCKILRCVDTVTDRVYCSSDYHKEYKSFVREVAIQLDRLGLVSRSI